jgi:hypothetical protein
MSDSLTQLLSFASKFSRIVSSYQQPFPKAVESEEDLLPWLEVFCISSLTANTLHSLSKRVDTEQHIMYLLDVCKRYNITPVIIPPGRNSWDPSAVTFIQSNITVQAALTGHPLYFKYLMGMTGFELNRSQSKEILSMMSVELLYPTELNSWLDGGSESLPEGFVAYCQGENKKQRRDSKKEILRHLNDTHPRIIGLKTVIETLKSYLDSDTIEEIASDLRADGETLIANLILQ